MRIKKNKPEITDRDERFQNVTFRGTFREYQQKVVDNFEKHLKNKKIHIVAAPGSGKTILGLELIRMLGKPALILSPTIAIREQWKERFEEMFVPLDKNVNDYICCSLFKPKLLTSITYQGLYTSYKKTAALLKAEEDDELNETAENYSSVNIIKLIEEQKISTLCLDEAHHLRAEWQRALYEFVANVEHSMTIISLTATPPYDSKKSEWDKYIAMCGPIDEEIFVPELVRAKNLCPHQDYIYYNFPTESETDVIEKYQQNVAETLQEIFAEGKFLEIITNSEFYKDPEEFSDELLAQGELVKSLLAFLDESGRGAPKELQRTLERDDRDVKWDLATAERLFQGMINDDQLFAIKDREYVKSFLSRKGLVEKNKVNLVTNEEVEKLLFSSIGKLASITSIVTREWENLGDDIRLLILTDYIRVNSAVLGSDREIKEMGVVPIFEQLRRQNLGIKLAAISGKIVIVPNASLAEIMEMAKKDGARIRAVAINGTEHSELKFEGTNSAQKIALVTKAFNAGVINGIVGTKSLLGEGWDSPVINTLILASFVGSFMLSNQMRGRAIRTDNKKPDKVSNIWHLTAILPQHLIPDIDGAVPSADYAMLQRRFHGFMGLNYKNDVIESGLSRASTLEVPYDEKNVTRANEETFALAKNRDLVRQRWDSALAKSTNEVIIQNEIPKPRKGFIPGFIIRPSHYSTIKKVTHAVVKTLKELKIINKKAKPVIEKEYKTKTVNVGIIKSSEHEKNLFHQAISEVLGPIDAPKYFLVKTKNAKPDYRASFAVPEIFANNKANAELFKEKMTRRITNFELYSSRSASGKQDLVMAKRRAYVNKTGNEIQAKMKLRPGSKSS